MIFIFFSAGDFLSFFSYRLVKEKNKSMLSPRIAPRGRAFSIARPAGWRAECFQVAITRRDDRREATDEARTPPMRRRTAIGDRSGGGGGGAPPPPPPRVVAAFSNPTSSPSPPPPPSPSALVDALLASVAGASADRGSSMSPSARAAADALVDDLVRAAEAERRGGAKNAAATSSSSPSSSSSSPSSPSSPSPSSPLDSPFLLGDFDVAYVSTGGRQKGQPAGGRFRSGLGRALFSTTAVCQSIFYDDDDDDDDDENVKEEEEKQLLVTNKVAFRLAGLLEGSVGLRGKVTAAFPSSDWKRAEMKGEGEGEKERAEERETGCEEEINDAVRVDFDPAVLSLLPRSKLFRLSLRIGRPSWVALATPYGELFLFCRRERGLKVREGGLRKENSQREKKEKLTG